MKLDKTKKYRVGEVVFKWVKSANEWYSKDNDVWHNPQDLIALGAVEVEEEKCKKCGAYHPYCPWVDKPTPFGQYTHIIEWLYLNEHIDDWNEAFIKMLKQELEV